MVINCFRFLGFKSLDQVLKLTPFEYNLMVQAYQLKKVDDMHRLHLQAFLNFKAQAKRKSGRNGVKPVYTSYKKFFDYEEELKHVRGQKKSDRFSRLVEYKKKRGLLNG